MKVLHALPTFLPVTENWLYPQVKQTPGTEVRVFCREVRNREVFPLRDEELCLDQPPWSLGGGVPRLLNSLAFRAGRRHWHLCLTLKRWRPDLLHAHFGMFGWEMLFLEAALGVPMIVSFYGMDAWLLPMREPQWKDRYQELFARSHRFLVEGPAMRERLRVLGCPVEKVLVHRLGVNVNGLPFRNRRFDGPLRVIMLARFVEKKGLPDGLAACADAVGRGVDLQVTIVGNAPADDPAGQAIERELRELAARPGLAGRVRFAGFLPLDETRRLMQEHDILLCPSKHSREGDGEGGSPLSLSEAMALGLLCIGTRHCDIPEVIVDGTTGFLCESGDIAGIAAALVRASQEAGLVPEICRRGRQHIEEKFSLERQAAERAGLYRSLLTPAPADHSPCASLATSPSS